MAQELEDLAVIEAALRLAVEQRSSEPLSRMFCDSLHFSPISRYIDRSNWLDSIGDLLTEDPHLLAVAEGVFIVTLCLAREGKAFDHEHLIISQVLRNLEHAVFVVTKSFQPGLHLIYAGLEAVPTPATRRCVLRRMELIPGEPLRFIAHRLAWLVYRPTADALQEVFGIETVTEQFLQLWEPLLSRLTTAIEEQTGDAQWARAFALDALDRSLISVMQYRSHRLPNSPFVSLRSLVSAALMRTSDQEPPYSVTIPDRIIDGIYGVLAYFPTTIHEDTPLDLAVAITPAILGSVYESLGMLNDEARNKRADMGVYYTPPSEVDLMCRLALVSYLVNVLGESHRNALYNAVFCLDPIEEANAEDALHKLSFDVLDRLSTALSTLTVLDPACGSGAFLIGMLHVLVQLTHRVDRVSKQTQLMSASQRIASIISDTLYGIDVQSQALRRAELRLGLAWQASDTCPEKNHEFPATHLTHGDAFFCSVSLPPIEGKTEQGFDIVIGNPPYVRQERISDPLQAGEYAWRPEFRRAYKRTIAEQIARLFPFFFLGSMKRAIDGKSDLSLYFFFRGFSWLNDLGVLCYVSSSAWLDAQYGAVLQEFLLRHGRIEMVLDTKARRSFTAAVNTCITLAGAPRRGKSAEEWKRLIRFVMLAIPYEQAVEASLFQEIALAQERNLTETTRYRVYPISHLDLLRDGMQNGHVADELDDD